MRWFIIVLFLLFSIHLKVNFEKRLRLKDAECYEKVDTLMITDYLCWTGEDFDRCEPEQITRDLLKVD